MKITRMLVVGGLLLLFAGCSSRVTFTPNRGYSPLRTQVEINTEDVAKAVGVYNVWVGTRIGQDGLLPLRIEYQLFGESVSGEYQLGPSGLRGRAVVDATLVDGIINGDLKFTTQCVYTFSGSVTSEVFTGRAEPTHCPGGSSVEWTLRRG